MCGIAGYAGKTFDDLLGQMSEKVSHRGPDGAAVIQFPGVHLAHRRLAITDLINGAQPMCNENGRVWIVFNGEIYNHRELRSELVSFGHKFKTDHCDTEVLIHGYEQWGISMLEKLNGMFAFCLYDASKNKLLLARDRFGQKPLYYSYGSEFFAFASELSAVVCHPLVNQNIDHLSLARYYAYGYVPAPDTIYSNVYKLEAGSWLEIDLSVFQKKCGRYWEYKIQHCEHYENASEFDIATELKLLLKQAVKRTLVADVPVGVFLSGGIDSSTILALACEQTNPANLQSFSIGFSDSEYDESWLAAKMAKRFGSLHREKILSIDKVKDVTDEVMQLLDEPMADSSILPTYLLCEYARNYVKVALSGDGGDELFAGYAPFRALKTASLYSNIVPKSIRPHISSIFDKLPANDGYLSLSFKIKKTLSGLNHKKELWNPVWMSPIDVPSINNLLGTSFSIDEIYCDAIQLWRNSEGKSDIDRTSEFYTRFYLQNGVLTKVDRASMMVGLEVRAPFLDNDVAEFASRIPSKLKVLKGSTKHILKKSMEDVLPHEILYRAKKGFAVPMSKWLKSWNMPRSSLDSLNENILLKLQKDHIDCRQDNRLFLWAYLVSEMHLKRSLL